jgi:hypothetical protein
MSRLKDLSWVLAALLLLGALYIYGIRALGGAGFAQGPSVAGSGQASTQTSATVSTTTPASSDVSTPKSTPAAQLSSKASATTTQTDIQKLRVLMAQSPKISAALLTRADTKMQTSVRLFDRNAEKLGDAWVAAWLASRLGKSPKALTREHNKLHTSWGQLMIAHRLAASCGNPWVTPGLLLQMKANGMGWGRIAAGLGLRLGSCVKSVGVEARVANGFTRAGARGAQMRVGGVRGGMSARVGLGAGMHAGMHPGRGLGHGMGHRMRVKLGK